MLARIELAYVETCFSLFEQAWHLVSEAGIGSFSTSRRRGLHSCVGPGKLMKITIGALALTLASSGGLHASILYSFGPDNVNDPRSFTSMNTLTSTATPLYNMNDVNAGFNGGVTSKSTTGLLYGLINDTLSHSTLISFLLNAGGHFTTPQPSCVGVA